MVRQSTWLTRRLQIGLSAYFIVEWIVAWPQVWATAETLRATGQNSGAWVVITASAVVTILIALLTYGSVRKWRWSFWGYLVLLGLAAVSLIQYGRPRSALDLFSDAFGAVLLAASLIALVRFGPWAMTTKSTTASPHTTP